MIYDLIVGAGLYGTVIVEQMTKSEKRCLVVERRTHIVGNVYSEGIMGIQVRKYGSHVFHTNNKQVWDYVNQFASFNRFTLGTIANYRGELHSLFFNMYTFNKMWSVTMPEEAIEKIEEQRKAAGIAEPQNWEEQAISLMSTDIYEKLIKGYTENSGARLPSPVIFYHQVTADRMTYDNNYFNALLIISITLSKYSHQRLRQDGGEYAGRH